MPESYLELERAPEGEEVMFDYDALRLTLRSHPLALMRPDLQQQPRFKLLNSKQLNDMPDGREVHTCGIVTTKQQPETAKGVIFLSLEDEEGEIQLIIYKGIWEKPHIRPVVLNGRLVAVKGRLQRAHGVCNIIASHLEDWSAMLGGLATKSRDFR